MQRQLGPKLAVTGGYSGSRGTNLRISRNINQPVDGVRPFAAVSPSSPILPGTPLGNITQVASTGFRTTTPPGCRSPRLSRGLQFEASYTWSKSLDTNSLNSSGFAVQDGNDIAEQYGLSDFDARHRFVLSATYALPFTGNVLTRGWRLAAVVQSQSGNPFNIVTSTSSLNGVAEHRAPGRDRADPHHRLGGPVVRSGAVRGRGPVRQPRRNASSGRPSTTPICRSSRTCSRGALRLQFRADVFDVFNHPNFGPPGNIVGSPTFGKISRTRLPTGEAGSSRQIQLSPDCRSRWFANFARACCLWWLSACRLGVDVVDRRGAGRSRLRRC